MNSVSGVAVLIVTSRPATRTSERIAEPIVPASAVVRTTTNQEKPVMLVLFVTSAANIAGR